MKINFKLSSKFEKELKSKIEAIQESTSVSIYVHVSLSDDNDALERAEEVFDALEVHKSPLRMGFLLYLSLSGKELVFLSDESLKNAVDESFFLNAQEAMIEHLKLGQVQLGIESALNILSSKLAVISKVQEGILPIVSVSVEE